MIAMDTHLVFRSPKLGDVTYGPDDVIRFPQGLPGFEALREFLLVTREECEPFVFLAALEKPEIALPLMPLAPATIGVAAPADLLAPLGPAGDNALGYYAVVTIARDAAHVQANLRAPVVVNLDTRLACQVILSDERLPLDARLPL
jgi:flagellar assembly factor FliW